MFSAAIENLPSSPAPESYSPVTPNRLPELFLLIVKVHALLPETATLLSSTYHIPENQATLGLHNDQISCDGSLTFEPTLVAYLNVTEVFLIGLTLLELR